ncbi:MAG: hypothetical protein ACSHX6_12400 [Akkermansiaceae bacterium]
MKFTIDERRAAKLLSEAYIPETGRGYTEEENGSLLKSLRSVIADKANHLEISIEEIGVVEYYSNGGELAFRGELLHWGILTNGLLLDLSSFLGTFARSHIIILTFDFQDEPDRYLESPTIIITASEIVGGFGLCELEDTPKLLGFK